MQGSVAGWLFRDGSVLLGLRSATGSQSGRWELPGGKVNPGESDQDALRREFAEECRLRVSVGELLARARFRHGGLDHEVRAYQLSADGNPVLGADHWQIRFVPVAELLSLPLVPSDRELISTILAAGATGQDGRS